MKFFLSTLVIRSFVFSFVSLGLSILSLPSPSVASPPPQGRSHLVARNSSSLELASKDLVLSKKELVFHCQDFECQVSADYEILASDADHFDFQFLAPGSDSLEVAMNDEHLRADVSEDIVSPSNACLGVFDCQNAGNGRAASKAPERWRYQCWHGEQRQICEDDLLGKSQPVCHTARVNTDTSCEESRTQFRASVRRGRNRLQIRYRQPLEVSAERSAARSSAELGFTYLLYPLQEWRFRENFQLSVRVLWGTPKRSLFGRLFLENHRELHCGSVSRENEEIRFLEASPEVRSRPITEKGRKYQEQVYQYGEEFPRIFGCRASAMELEEDYHNNVEKFLAAADVSRESMDSPQTVSKR